MGVSELILVIFGLIISILVLLIILEASGIVIIILIVIILNICYLLALGYLLIRKGGRRLFLVIKFLNKPKLGLYIFFDIIYTLSISVN